MTRNCLPRGSRAFTVIELLVVIGILSFLATMAALLEPALRTADRMRQQEALAELGIALGEVSEDVRVAGEDTRTAVIGSLADRQIDREQAALLARRFETAAQKLGNLVERMEELKPRLASEADRQLLCDAIEVTRKLLGATQRLATAWDVIALSEFRLE